MSVSLKNTTSKGGLQQQTQWGLDNKRRIEQMIQNLPYCCRTNTRTGFCYQSGTQYAHCFCKKLTCRTCAGRLYTMLNRNLLDASRTHSLAYFVTLTLPTTVPPIRQARTLRRHLRALLHEARRTFIVPPKLMYAWVLGGNAKRLHLHLLINRDLRRAQRYGRSTRWLKNTWHHLAGADQIRVQQVKAGTEDRVVTYMLKNFLETLQGCPQLNGRRFGYSRGLGLNSRPKKGNSQKWTRVAVPTAQIAIRYGLETNPITNGTVDVQDAPASFEPGRAEPPLDRSVLQDTTVPAGGRGGAGTSLKGVAVPPASAMVGSTPSRLQASLTGRRP